MKAVKRLFVVSLISVGLLAVPKQSHAGIIGDILKEIFGGGDKDKKNPPSTGNSVPLDGGITLLLAAGMGLGAKKLYEKKKTQAAE